MSFWKCPHCQRRFDDDSAYREGYEARTWDEPGGVFDGCRVCVKDADEIESALDAKADQQLEELRCGDGTDGYPY